MINVSQIFVSPNLTIGKALKVINTGAVKIAIVVNDNNQLLGTLSDGDLRRGLISKKSLDDHIEDIYFKTPITASRNESRESLLNLCSFNHISQIPIIDSDRKVVDLFFLDDELSKKQFENNVVLMVGGLGSRLRPLTENIPKPMLSVGGKPILQTIVKGFVDKGFNKITMCLGYKSNVIQKFFKDGSEFGATIDYVEEDKQMGTAGALTLLTKKLNKPFFVMNGDLLTNINYEQMLDYHYLHNSIATMCVREYDIQVPYGVVNTNNEEIISIEEKPVHSFFVNAGIYLLEPECIKMIPKNEYYDMTSLFEKIISKDQKAISFPLRDYWLDIGKESEYKKANNDFSNVF